MSASSIRAGAAYIELTLRDRVSRPLQSASVALRDFGNAVAWQGAQIAAMGAAITAPLAAIAHSFASAALEGAQFVNRRDAANVMGYVQALMRLQGAFGELRNAIGSAVLPLMQRWPNALARIITQAAAWVRANRQLVQTIARVAAVVVTAGTIIATAGKAIAIVGTALGGLATVASAASAAMAIVGTAVAAVLSPLGLLAVAAGAFGVYMATSTGVAGQALGWLQGRFAELKDDALKSWKAIGDALATGDIALAGKILWLTLKMEWQKGVNFINQLWITAKESFLQLWTDAVFGTAMLFTDGWSMIETAWTETVSFLQKGWLNFTAFMTKKMNWAVGELEKMWVRFRKWMGEDVDVNARVREIDATTKQAEQNLATDTAAKTSRTEQRRQARRAEIESTRRGTQENLARDAGRAQAANVGAFDGERRRSEQAVAAAKTELDDARRTAADQLAVFDRQREPGGIPIVLGDQQQKLESRGTFNAAAARGIGADSLAERTARATERGADLLKQIEQRVRNAGAVFA